MAHYIDGFILPIPRKYLKEYQRVAEQVAAIWKEYGALSYIECVGDELSLEGTRSFADVVELKEDEVVILGWTTFPSKAKRDEAMQNVPKDARMHDLVAPLTHPDRLIFDASRMVFGGFLGLVGV